ncbi:hypothetical protein [Sphingomonas arenae]|uniref:hypothetical protein n=1 Tax=Sphingomonas arenae TaxID=2812555 RepID=UPI001968171F|nr:hypothetical protein [Sphingomonas arenae]
MRRSILSTTLVCVIALAGCRESAPRQEGLEQRVVALEQQNRDLRMKMAASQSLLGGRTGLENFFDAPEFWECTYDSGWSDCASRCTKQTRAGYQACLSRHPEGPARQQCVTENAQRGSACLNACPKQTNPISPPGC